MNLNLNLSRVNKMTRRQFLGHGIVVCYCFKGVVIQCRWTISITTKMSDWASPHSYRPLVLPLFGNLVILISFWAVVSICLPLPMYKVEHLFIFLFFIFFTCRGICLWSSIFNRLFLLLNFEFISYILDTIQLLGI